MQLLHRQTEPRWGVCRQFSFLFILDEQVSEEQRNGDIGRLSCSATHNMDPSWCMLVLLSAYCATQFLLRKTEWAKERYFLKQSKYQII